MARTKRGKAKRRGRKQEPDAEKLFAEMMGLVESAGSEIAKARRSGTGAREVPLAKLQKALSSGAPFNALTKVRELIPDDGAGAREVVVYGYACILETNSAGLSILFDRFDDDELRKFDASLKSIGATRTLTALREMRRLFDQSMMESPAVRKLDREFELHVEEMEQRLLAFCKAHLSELAAG